MMSPPAVQARNLSKLYRIGGRPRGYLTARDELSRWLLQKRNPNEERDFWALKDVSFEIAEGEAIGIIGRNGAGKSTLLKILSRITYPTTGEAHVRGRIASLLEVGTGFHQELTGRENIFLNGSVLGMSRQDIKSRFDEIVEFSGLSNFLDTPVKRYSSGMAVRLGFAVAAHLEPDILVVDEVLAVGDAQFQKKCLGKMSETNKHGRTLIFVSHNMSTINRLCQKVLLIDHGQITYAGDSVSATARYLGTTTTSPAETLWNDQATAPGDDRVRLAGVRLLAGGQVSSSFGSKNSVTLEVDYWLLQPGPLPVCSASVVDESDIPVATFADHLPDAWKTDVQPGLFRSIASLPAGLFNEGQYRVGIEMMSRSPGLRRHILLPDVVSFSVVDNPDQASVAELWGRRLPGSVRPHTSWETRPLTSLEK